MIEKRLETVRFAFCLWPKTHSTTIIRCSRESKQFNWHRCEIDTKRTHTWVENKKKMMSNHLHPKRQTNDPRNTFHLSAIFSFHVFGWRNTNQNIYTYNMPFNRRESILRRRLYFRFVRSCFYFFFFCSSTTFQCVFQMSNSTAPHRARAHTLWAHERVKCGTSTLMYTLVCTNPYSTVCLRAVCRQQVWLNENNKFIFIYLVKMCQRVFAPRHRAKLELCASTSARIRVSRGWLSLK